MVSLLVDEAYAFDFLCILQVKSDKTNLESAKQTFLDYMKVFTMQFGRDMMNEIIGSEEYARLYATNLHTFDLVDMAKTDSCKASDVDRANYERCKARKALQDKFFPGRQITETKTGEEVYDK